MTAPLTRWKLHCAYDGTDFSGWQSQVSGKGVQDYIERSLSHFLKKKTRISGSGRTDAGVHAWDQVCHFDAAWSAGTEALRRAIQSKLPQTIQVRELLPIHPDFHARRSAIEKIYRYTLSTEPVSPFDIRFVWAIPYRLDLERMHAAAQTFIGEHDFRAFSAIRNRDEPDEPSVRVLSALSIQPHQGGRIQIHLQANGFLYKMARRIVGTLVQVGKGRLAAHELSALLEKRERVPQILTAPPQGLCLQAVRYES